MSSGKTLVYSPAGDREESDENDRCYLLVSAVGHLGRREWGGKSSRASSGELFSIKWRLQVS